MERTERVIDMKPQVHEIMSRADRQGCVKMKSCFLGKWDFVFGVWGICSSEMNAPRTIAPKSEAWAGGDRGKVTLVTASDIERMVLILNVTKSLPEPFTATFHAARKSMLKGYPESLEFRFPWKM